MTKYCEFISFRFVLVILLLLIGADNIHPVRRVQTVCHLHLCQQLPERRNWIGIWCLFLGKSFLLQGLEPGDIVMGGWSNCAYGRYSHAGLYVGNNQVLEGDVDYGLSVQTLGDYMKFTQLCLLRVEASPEVKKKAVDYAMAHQGEMFYPVAFKQGERYWNCTKIIWEAYEVQGINLDEINDLWIAPEKFADSSMVKKLYEKGISNS